MEIQDSQIIPVALLLFGALLSLVIINRDLIFKKK